MTPSDSKHYLDLAARLALRGRGHVEPNPIVGAVIVKDGRIIGRGHHRRFGGLHAETEALADCRRQGHDPRGSTLYVTLEPCNHYGKQPPCTKAVIEAGIARVVVARVDPNSISAGGAESLRRAGIDVEFTDVSPLAVRISDPFIKRLNTGLPWVIAKWAQTSDGRLVTRPDEPRWISNEFSRRRVHRLRGRVDAVVTGIGTVLADDPLLTVRGVRARRTPMRVVLDSMAQLPLNTNVMNTVKEAPLTVCVSPDAISARGEAVDALRRAGATVEVVEGGSGHGISLVHVLRRLGKSGVSTVLFEAGPGLNASLLRESIADELVVYIGSAEASYTAPQHDGYVLVRSRRVAGDLELTYWRSEPPAAGD